MEYNYNADTAVIQHAEKDCGLHAEYMEIFYEVFGFTPTQPAGHKYLVIPKTTWHVIKRFWVLFITTHHYPINVPDPGICSDLRDFLTGIMEDIEVIKADVYVTTTKP